MEQSTNLRLEKLKQILVSSLPLLLAKYIKMLKLLSIGKVSVEKYRYRYRYSKKIPIFTDTDPPSLAQSLVSHSSFQVVVLGKTW